jgi:hypothetical protein
MRSTQRAILRLILGLCLGALTAAPAQASAIQINRIQGNGANIETAHLSSYDGRIYVTGRVKVTMPTNPIAVRVDLKDADGRIIASQTAHAYPAGRRQIVAAFGVHYVVSFDAARAKDVTSVDVTYIQ